MIGPIVRTLLIAAEVVDRLLWINSNKPFDFGADPGRDPYSGKC